MLLGNGMCSNGPQRSHAGPLFTWRWGTSDRWGNTAGHPAYHVNVIKLKWEIIWTGGLSHLSGLPHLPGVPHLHVDRPLVCPQSHERCTLGLVINWKKTLRSERVNSRKGWVMGITVSLQKSMTIVMQNFGGYARCIIVYVKTGE